jgi:hypothetical protein
MSIYNVFTGVWWATLVQWLKQRLKARSFFKLETNCDKESTKICVRLEIVYGNNFVENARFLYSVAAGSHNKHIRSRVSEEIKDVFGGIREAITANLWTDAYMKVNHLSVRVY